VREVAILPNTYPGKIVNDVKYPRIRFNRHSDWHEHKAPPSTIPRYNVCLLENGVITKSKFSPQTVAGVERCQQGSVLCVLATYSS